jgi:Tol biopolymer transport system component
MDDRRQDRYASFELQILHLKTGETEVIGDGSEAFVDSQCWSPDDKQVVYKINKPVGVQIVRVYDAQAKTSKDLASGGHATWSPDGSWIAFLNCPPSLRGCKYYGMRTSTNEQKLFFKTDGQTGLSWSPDCRFVAYVNVASPFERTPPEQLREMLRLRVRRLEDNAEYSVADFFDGDIMWFDWTS